MDSDRRRPHRSPAPVKRGVRGKARPKLSLIPDAASGSGVQPTPKRLDPLESLEPRSPTYSPGGACTAGVDGKGTTAWGHAQFPVSPSPIKMAPASTGTKVKALSGTDLTSSVNRQRPRRHSMLQVGLCMFNQLQ
ncbi:hypothetical protein KIPB_005437 [Kipferlia bialata]|uniref:Uncharacterized protein n=1 Tax=Kipferlia bialata TaxID=797122 RepID=A0A391NL82_9EUKA|nr:hypothetical protein KIPB_005437 [Kipferlia bialata]|eukprot:g5437.t1